MLRIGIIGSDSSHAPAFASLANLPGPDGHQLYSDVRVTAIWGEDATRTRQVAEDCHIPTVAADPQEIVGTVDAVMVVLRHGALHARYALPFLRAGIPTWVDKPFAISETDARQMISQAGGTLLAGGSTCKYCPDVLALRQDFSRLQAQGDILGGTLSFPGDLASPYGGVYFYGGHSIEMLTTIFGDEIRSFRAATNHSSATVLARYDNFDVTLHLVDVTAFWGGIFSAAQVIMRPIDISTVYREGFARFVEMLRGGPPPQKESLLCPVLLLNTLAAALETGKETPCPAVRL